MKQPFVSAGFIIINDNKILLVESTDTYQANSLLAGRYQNISNPRLFVSKMTLNEKKKFIQDTYNPVPDIKKCYKNYNVECKSKLIDKLTNDFIKNLNILKPHIIESIAANEDGPLPLSYPKGLLKIASANSKTEMLDSAIKSLYYETKITSDMITTTPFYINQEYTDELTYKFILFIAYPKANFSFHLDKSDINQTQKVKSINWYSYQDMINLKTDDITKVQITYKIPDILKAVDSASLPDSINDTPINEWTTVSKRTNQKYFQLLL